MKLLRLVLSICLIASTVSAQSGWVKQESGTTENLNAVFFTNIYNGIIVGANGTLLRTTNGGSAWQKLSSGTTNNLSKVIFSDSSNGIILGSNKTYLQTKDGGTTWVDKSNNIQEEFVSISFINNKNGIAVGATSPYSSYPKNIFITRDGGDSWELLSKIVTGGFQPLNIHYSDYNTISVIGSGINDTQIFNSLDGGITWKGQMLSGTGYFSDASFIDAKNGFILAYHGMTSQYYGTIHKTTDEGLSWQQLSDWKLPQCRSISMIDNSIGFAVGNNDAYLGSAKPNAIYKTSDGGTSWIKQNSNTENKLNDVYFTDKNNGTIVGDNGTILRTNSGGEITGTQWTIQNSPSNYYFRNIAFAGKSNVFVVGDHGMILKSFDSGKSWITSNLEFGQNIIEILDVCFPTDSIGYMLVNDNWKYKLLVSTNCGDTWTLRYTSPPSRGRMSFINSNVGLLANSGTAITLDGGFNWPYKNVNNYRFNDICLVTPTIAFGVTNFIWATSNGGLDWYEPNTSILTTSKIYSLNGVTFFNTKEGIAVGGIGGIIKTTDGGVNWSIQNSGTTNTLNDILFTDKNNGIIVGNSGTILTTTNGGIDWKKEIAITGEHLFKVAIKDSVVLCMGSTGMILRYTKWPINKINTDTANINPVIPSTFSLSQNYPNPFNPSTTIKYSIPFVETLHGASPIVVLKIYDVLGREVATLVNEEKAPGNYEVVFNGANLSSGVYFYKMSCGNFSETKKLVLMK